ncbi:DNA/RNA non-specific endonuclease [Prevotella sp.]
MYHLFLKTIILFLSLIVLPCQGSRKRQYISIMDKPLIENNNNTILLNLSSEQDNTKRKNPKTKLRLEIPISKKQNPSLILYREGYTASYNPETRTPNWVAWHLTANHTDGPVKRNGISFQADQDIPEPRVDTYDYMRSGYDRGHMCPAGDNHWSQKAMEQSFLMTNVCPQVPALNSGLWNTIEKQCRTWAEQYGDVYIVCGPIYFNQKHKTIGKNKVQVPEAFFKVILCLRDKPKAIGFICRNASAKGHKKNDYVNSIDEVERITGLDFFSQLPDNIEQRVESHADITEW